MADIRTLLAEGTLVAFESGNIFKITGKPVGSGGGSIIYPVQRVYYSEGQLVHDDIMYALKECYPVSHVHTFVRNEKMEIVPSIDSEAEWNYLRHARTMQLSEKKISQQIYKTGFRLLPVLESSDKAVITCGDKTYPVNNTYTLMEDISTKGHTLNSYIKEYSRLTTLQTFLVIQQLLFALREVHDSGFLHLDIQDGNILIKGSLNASEGLLTLIDFGSSRAVIEGKTAPITDKVIFTTPGFSAPEIISRNDGTLRLGAETDIYSVGCLMLYLLTGIRYDTNALLHNTSGKYLTPFKLRKIDCPKHLIDSMQRIIARALEKDPENRYHSPSEMLEDVSEFIKALTPGKNILKAIKYDAFISYKHSAADSAAAKALQRNLEHFKAPKGVSELRRPFKKIFIDEGELSSCADYGEQIKNALKNSGWLIVICSPATPLSPWVKMEIDLFLQYHDRSRILAVMTDGSPAVSFPEQLKGDCLGGSEVLAADARGRNTGEILSNLKKDPLLKIASSMLEVPFDALKQRHRTYMLRKTISICAAVIVILSLFSAYILYQAINLKAKNSEILLKQANVLSIVSDDLLEVGEREDALLVALEAMKLNTGNPAAQLALENALYPYKTYDNNHYYSLATLELNAAANAYYAADYDNGIFAISDVQGRIYYWNILTGELLSSYSDSSEEGYVSAEQNILLLDDHTSIVCNNQAVYCFDFIKNSVIWLQKKTEDFDIETDYMLISPDCSTLYAFITDYKDLYLVNINVSDGSIGEKQLIISAESSIYIGDTAINPDGSQIACSCFSGYGTVTDTLTIYDIADRSAVYTTQLYPGSDHEKYPLDSAFFAISSLSFAADNKLLAYCSQDTLSLNYVYENLHYQIYLYDTESFECLWTYEDSYMKAEGIVDIFVTEYQKDDSSDNINLINIQNDSEKLCFDFDGNLLSKYSYSQSIAGTSHNNGIWNWVVTWDGVAHKVMRDANRRMNDLYSTDVEVSDAARSFFFDDTDLMLIIPSSGKKMYLYGHIYNSDMIKISDLEVYDFALSDSNMYYGITSASGEIEVRSSATDELLLAVSDAGTYPKNRFGFISDYFYYLSGNILKVFSLNDVSSVQTAELTFPSAASDPEITAYSENGIINFLLHDSGYIELIQFAEGHLIEKKCYDRDSILNIISGLFGKKIASVFDYDFIYSPCGDIIISADFTSRSSNPADTAILVWNVARDSSYILEGIRNEHDNAICTLSQDGSLLFIVDNNYYIHVIESSSGNEIDIIVPENPSDYLSIIYSPADEYVYLQTKNYELLSYDLKNSHFVSGMRTREMTVSDYHFSDDASVMYLYYSSGLTISGTCAYSKTGPGEYAMFSAPYTKWYSDEYYYVTSSYPDAGFFKIPFFSCRELTEKAESILNGRELTDLKKKQYGIE